MSQTSGSEQVGGNSNCCVFPRGKGNLPIVHRRESKYGVAIGTVLAPGLGARCQVQKTAGGGGVTLLCCLCSMTSAAPATKQQRLGADSYCTLRALHSVKGGQPKQANSRADRSAETSLDNQD